MSRKLRVAPLEDLFELYYAAMINVNFDLLSPWRFCEAPSKKGQTRSGYSILLFVFLLSVNGWPQGG